MELFEQDALYYAEQVRTGMVSITSLVQRALSNIEALNPILNAVSIIQTKSALALAEQYDQEIAKLSHAEREALPAFFGVPILLKDLGQLQANQRSTSGAFLMAQYVAKESDAFVQAIERLGFVIVGRTNTPEFGFKNISDSQLNGIVNLPFDLTRNAGGSSGGAGAALASGMVPIVTASDGGGSIRIPASFNGLIGLKPSRGRIPVGPHGYRSWQGASVNFALTKSVRDTWELLKGLQEEQYDALFMVPRISEVQLLPPTRPLRIAYTLQTPTEYPLCDEAKEAVLQTATHLREMGHEVIESAPAFDGITMMKDYYLVNGVETAAMMGDFGRTIKRDDMELMSWALYQLGLTVSGVEYSRLLSRWDNLTVIMEKFYQDVDVWIMPTTNGVAPLHYELDPSPQLKEKLHHVEKLNQEEKAELVWQMFDAGLERTPFCMLMNIAGQPAISLPLSIANNLPLGVQFSAAKGKEYMLLQLSLQFEQKHLFKNSKKVLTPPCQLC